MPPIDNFPPLKQIDDVTLIREGILYKDRTLKYGDNYNHHLATGDADFKRAIKPGNIENSADASLIEREVGTYAKTIRANFVAEVFAGRCADRKFPSTVMRL